MVIATLLTLATTAAHAETPISDALCSTSEPLADHALVEGHKEQAASPSDVDALNNLYISLSGRWHGTLQEVVCVGHGDTVRDQWRYFVVSDANATVRADGSVRMTSTKERLDSRNGLPGNRVISVTPQAKTDYYTAQNLNKLDVVNNHEITTRVQYHQSNRLVSATSVTGASNNLTNVRTREDTLTLTGDHLSITTHWYTNGVYSGTEFTELSRR